MTFPLGAVKLRCRVLLVLILPLPALLACEALALFNLLLSPHYDDLHRDHFHFEVRRGVRWFLTN